MSAASKMKRIMRDAEKRVETLQARINEDVAAGDVGLAMAGLDAMRKCLIGAIDEVADLMRLVAGAENAERLRAQLRASAAKQVQPAIEELTKAVEKNAALKSDFDAMLGEAFA